MIEVMKNRDDLRFQGLGLVLHHFQGVTDANPYQQPPHIPAKLAESMDILPSESPRFKRRRVDIAQQQVHFRQGLFNLSKKLLLLCLAPLIGRNDPRQPRAQKHAKQ